ncbi:MAG TPA: hypothetical protein VJO52_17275 [Gemmatimonadaceae bacterium]|nr:hypothetical protein [Gemmatimonadaceae bacterium]
MTRTLARLARITDHARAITPGRAGRYAGLAAAVLVAACVQGDGAGGGVLADSTPPVVSVTAAAPSSDSVVAFNVLATDNLGLLAVRVSVSGPGISGAFDTTFNTAVTSVTLPYTVPVPSTVPPGTTVTVIASAVDGAHNVSKADTAFIGTGNQSPSVAIITNPKANDTAVVGFTMAVSLSGKSPNMVKALGFIASGVFATPVTDSVLYNSPLKDSVGVDTSVSLVGATTGTLTLTPFVMDSLKRRILGLPVNVVVANSAAGNSVPVVDFGITSRIEVTDTMHVSAHDRAGVRWLGYEVRNLPSDPNTFFAADSFQVTGSVSSALHTFKLGLNITAFPKEVQVSGFARNTNGTRAYALLSDGVTQRGDTVDVVAGLTRTLPNGGVIADALYHKPTNRLYLSNIEKNELEVFDLTDSAFQSPIIVGSRPWGITAWPANRDGTMGDTILVANSGGTLISYVNVHANADVEVFPRYALPNIIPYTVTSVQSTTAPGQIIEQRTPYDFSDRPQYIAATCKGPTAGPAACGDVILVYSTTPTGGQSLPFTNQGTVRWEDLTNHTSHFFFEQAMGQTAGRSDTLEVERFGAQGIGSADSLLVQFKELGSGGIDTTGFSIVVRIDQLAFRDTTFVRNSGNFRRAILGEGGSVLGSRAIMYDVTTGFQTQFTNAQGTFTAPAPEIDNGVSRPLDVSDFISNAFARVNGVAINFDGELAAIRGDSTYIIDRTLRLQGLLQTSGGNPGFDFHPDNAGIGPATSPPGTRLSFAASSSPQIEVYDTFNYNRCLIVPTRDPIVGPIKAAKDAAGNVVLVGATQFGVVIVSLTQAQLATSCPSS